MSPRPARRSPVDARGSPRRGPTDAGRDLTCAGSAMHDVPVGRTIPIAFPHRRGTGFPSGVPGGARYIAATKSTRRLRALP